MPVLGKPLALLARLLFLGQHFDLKPAQHPLHLLPVVMRPIRHFCPRIPVPKELTRKPPTRHNRSLNLRPQSRKRPGRAKRQRKARIHQFHPRQRQSLHRLTPHTQPVLPPRPGLAPTPRRHPRRRVRAAVNRHHPPPPIQQFHRVPPLTAPKVHRQFAHRKPLGLKTSQRLHQRPPRRRIRHHIKIPSPIPPRRVHIGRQPPTLGPLWL